MNRWKAILQKLIFPGRIRVLLTSIFGGISLILTFGTQFGDTFFAYISYFLSAYGLTVLTAAIVPAFSRIPKFLHNIPLAHRYLTDKYFSVWYGMAFSFAVNLAFSVLKLTYAVLYSSFWEGGLAIYNILLCVVRLYLLRSFPKGQKCFSYREELRRCRVTGRLLFLLDAVLAVISALIVIKGNRYHYPGTLIYAVAAYAFYSLTLAIINAIRYRKFNSPVLSAAKAVNLTTALVSIFSMETAMIGQFGANQPYFRLIMTSCTGFAVCVSVLGGAVYMVTKSGKLLKQLEQNDKTITNKGGAKT